MHHNIIGVVGCKRHGKDTVADYLCAHYDFIKRPFAFPLKRMCQEVFVLTRSQVDGDQKEVVDPRWGVSPRTILQKVGTDLFREQLHTVLPDLPTTSIWCLNFQQWVGSLLSPSNIVVSDVRFPDEVELLQHMGAHLVRVVRPDCKDNDSHASEQHVAQLPVDRELNNNGTIADLHAQVHNFMEEHVFAPSAAPKRALTEPHLPSKRVKVTQPH